MARTWSRTIKCTSRQKRCSTKINDSLAVCQRFMHEDLCSNKLKSIIAFCSSFRRRFLWSWILVWPSFCPKVWEFCISQQSEVCLLQRGDSRWAVRFVSWPDEWGGPTVWGKAPWSESTSSKFRIPFQGRWSLKQQHLRWRTPLPQTCRKSLCIPGHSYWWRTKCSVPWDPRRFCRCWAWRNSPHQCRGRRR